MFRLNHMSSAGYLYKNISTSQLFANISIQCWDSHQYPAEGWSSLCFPLPGTRVHWRRFFTEFLSPDTASTAWPSLEERIRNNTRLDLISYQWYIETSPQHQETDNLPSSPSVSVGYWYQCWVNIVKDHQLGWIVRKWTELWQSCSCEWVVRTAF